MIQAALAKVADASWLLNIIASFQAPAILNWLGGCIVPEQAAREVIYLRKGGTGADAGVREPIDLDAMTAAGLLTITSPASHAELAAYAHFAIDLDDGEAAASALAVTRGGVLLCDDRKAASVMLRRSPATHVITTSATLKEWADSTAVDQVMLAGILRNIEERASFRLGAHDPLVGWWDSAKGP